ncbi:putative ABC transport system permease protein [Nitrospirillum amazonense]|uniref:Putative ABC transport system permease protein n=2 Tax=Nitrospirillum amazonense TaxID=28077 RepID=A0A560ESS4_9PROT|nr:putative ABC transport system permease protein [Nitrospirillum amazonense]
MSLVNQIAAVTALNFKSMPQRTLGSLSTVVAVTLVVTVLLAFLAMGEGFQKTIRGSGAADVALFLRAGAQAEANSSVTRDQLRLIEEAPGIASDASGKPLVSGELYVVVDGIKKSSNTKANLPLRGISLKGTATRPGFRIVAGRMFAPGANEIVVGSAVLKEFNGMDVGSTVRFGTSTWTVVGVFDLGGSIFESELWADIDVVQNLFQRQNVFQLARVKLEDPSKLVALKAFSEGDPKLKLEVVSEADYYAKQARSMTGLIQKLGWPLAIAMALGALAGALNTMYNSVASRAHEIATLRCIGFGGLPAFVGTLLESLALAALGGLAGSLVTWLLFDGMTASTLGSNFTQVVFKFDLSPFLVLQGILIALVVGVVGGVFPAWQAARMPVLHAYNRS